MKNKLLLLIAALGLAGASVQAQSFIGNPDPVEGESGVFAYWNFNTFDPAEDTSLAADFGTATLSLSNWDGAVDDFNGNVGNAQLGDVAGASLSLVNQTGNGSFIEFSFSMSNLEDLVIDYWTRKTGTGFNSNQWSYSTNGSTFTNFGAALDPNSSTGGALENFSTSALNGAPTAFLRYTLDGASSGSGNNRIDNLTLSATAIPEPSMAALMVIGIALIGRFLRKK